MAYEDRIMRMAAAAKRQQESAGARREMKNRGITAAYENMRNMRRADIGPVGRSPLTRNEIAENRWNAIPAGVYDMSGQGKTWFPSIEEEDRPFAYDSGLTPAGGPILTRDEISENVWNAMPEGNIKDM